MTDIWIVVAGFILIIVGLGHKLVQFKTMDVNLFHAIYCKLNHPLLIRMFQILWPLGTTPITIIALIVFTLILRDFGTGSLLILVWAFAAIIERVVKVIINRQRPFNQIQEVEMQQPRAPKDPSFPSGDALRIWYIGMVFVFVAGPTWYSFTIALITATLVSLGRIVLGVHYPLDVLAGSGLGLAAYGIWHLFFLYV